MQAVQGCPPEDRIWPSRALLHPAPKCSLSHARTNLGEETSDSSRWIERRVEEVLNHRETGLWLVVCTNILHVYRFDLIITLGLPG